jgi:HK97 family phage prohead protease
MEGTSMPAAAKSSITIQIKSLGEDGSFEGNLAVYNNVDLGGDLIEPGAFTKTISERGGVVPLLWQHKADTPIGTLTLVDGPNALKVKGQLVMDLEDAKRAYILIKARVIKGLSIGFDTIKDSVSNGVRTLKEIRLWEGSIVTFPMNEMAMITSVKTRGGIVLAAGETKDDFNGELAVIQIQDAGYQMRAALFQALGSVMWGGGLSKDDKVTASATSIDQFKEAFMAWLPQYLDWLAAEYGDMETMSKLHAEEKNFGALLNTRVKAAAPVTVTIDARGMTPDELKKGAKFSAATKKALKQAHEHVKGLTDIFGTLLPDEDDDDDTDDEDDEDDDDKGAAAAPEVKTEPVENHSAAEEEILISMRSLIPKAS